MKFNLLSRCVHRTNPKHPADKPSQSGLLCISLQANGKSEPLPQLLVAVWQSWPDMVTARVNGAEASLRNAFLSLGKARRTQSAAGGGKECFWGHVDQTAWKQNMKSQRVQVQRDRMNAS